MRDLMRKKSTPTDLFGQMRDAFRSWSREFPSWPSWSEDFPAVDVKEEDERYRIQADLPGMTRDEVDVRVTDDSLTIASNKEEEKEEREEGYLVRERGHASFTRTFRLPSDVDRDRIDASFKDGVLEIELPRTGKLVSRKIDVRS